MVAVTEEAVDSFQLSSHKSLGSSADKAVPSAAAAATEKPLIRICLLSFQLSLPSTDNREMLFSMID